MESVVGRVQAEEGATRGSIASEGDLELVTRWLQRRRSLRQRWLTSETRWIGILGFLIALVAWLFPRSAASNEATRIRSDPGTERSAPRSEPTR